MTRSKLIQFLDLIVISERLDHSRISESDALLGMETEATTVSK
jgi:hypothetical protein